MYANDPSFIVPPGMLTPSGMRQRVLFGMMNKQRYIDQYKIIDETYNPN